VSDDDECLWVRIMLTGKLGPLDSRVLLVVETLLYEPIEHCRPYCVDQRHGCSAVEVEC
jgi:hypothetical protein